ncbi:MAG: L-2-hydroxyglutarate oxidase [Deinococcus sp.]|nr:L-2-hydroxyglutarate oxidase [Deinococcus sp.]
MVSPLPYNVAIVGGGIVGLATGLALLQRQPALRLVILEKEAQVGTHQTGHNSGVIHSGVYYRPGSLKARLCVEGVRRLMAYCAAQGVPYQRCGKVIVGTTEQELGVLEQLYQRGMANGVPGLRKIGPAELKELEPHAAGQAALYSPGTSIVDFRQVAQAMAADLSQRGAEVITGAEVRASGRDGGALRLETKDREVAASFLINCAGLYADVVARRLGLRPKIQIIPFRGEYYLLRPERRELVRSLIYPVPDPQFPFLGVHFTRTIHGQVEAGPNAVLAWAREGYSRWRICPDELWGTLTYRGFLALVPRYWRTALFEYYRSFSRRVFVQTLQRLVPAVQPADVVPGGAGVRAQAVAPDGRLVDDFHIEQTPTAIHVLNAPSPAATASLAIGDYIAELASKTFVLGG